VRHPEPQPSHPFVRYTGTASFGWHPVPARVGSWRQRDAGRGADLFIRVRRPLAAFVLAGDLEDGDGLDLDKPLRKAQGFSRHRECFAGILVPKNSSRMGATSVRYRMSPGKAVTLTMSSNVR
jgi:hypothetical protein